MSEYEKQLEKQNGELQQMLAELQEKYEIRYFSNLERIASTCVHIQNNINSYFYDVDDNNTILAYSSLASQFLELPVDEIHRTKDVIFPTLFIKVTSADGECKINLGKWSRIVTKKIFLFFSKKVKLSYISVSLTINDGNIIEEGTNFLSVDIYDKNIISKFDDILFRVNMANKDMSEKEI
jgi:hypothetical protein